MPEGGDGAELVADLGEAGCGQWLIEVSSLTGHTALDSHDGVACASRDVDSNRPIASGR
jgi:hypothetical protein